MTTVMPLSKRCLLASFYLSFLVPLFGHARKTDFTEDQRGIVLGIGQYFFNGIKSQHQFEPASQWRSQDQNLINLERYSIHPLKAGMQWANFNSNFELYYRHIFNTKKTWTSLENPGGKGLTKLRGHGGGALLGIRILGDATWRLMLNGQAEYTMMRARLEFQPDGDIKEIVNLYAHSITAGGGLSWEYWFADMWVLSILGGYLYPYPATWSIKGNGAEFLGVDRGSGDAVTVDGNTKLNALFGGFYVEANLKINFFFL